MTCLDPEQAPAATNSERRKKLADLKVHPRETAANRAALARAARCYEHFLAEKREEIQRVTSTFEAVLDRRDLVAADHARVQLLAALDRLEGQSFL
jgi:molecular chaperone HscC